MHTLQSPLTIMETLSKTPGNSGLWHLFLADLVDAMLCDSGFLSITDLSNNGGNHYLYRFNIAPEHQRFFELNLRNPDSFDAKVAKHPHQVLSYNPLNRIYRRNDGSSAHDPTGKLFRFGVSLPLNSRYAYCMFLNSSRPALELELHNCVYRLEMLVPQLQQALQKEQWLSLYNQITLLTGQHVAAYIIVDRALNVLFSEPVFNRIIADMNCVEIKGRRLAFLNKITEQRVLALMAGNDYDIVTTQSQCTSCTITVIPARTLDNMYAWEFYKKGVLLTFTSDHENTYPLMRLMELYKLTKCEALCALHFIATPSIPDIAASTHRSTETVRNHIKSIMQKLDVHNQGALMKKLLTIVSL